MTTPLLSVLLIGLQSRPWWVVSQVLGDQAERHGGAVEVLTDIDNGKATSGAKRHRLSRRARGEYVAWVDDDDRVDPCYMDRLVEACRQGPDVVGFDLSFAVDGQSQGMWRFGLWPDGPPDEHGTRDMAANHLCAWRREIAERVAWCPKLGNGDDQLWYRPLHAAGLARTIVRIDRVLYYYDHSTSTTVNQQRKAVAGRRSYVGPGLRCFRVGGQLLIEVGGRPRHRGRVLVRDADNQEQWMSLAGLEHFHTVEIV